MCNRRSSHRGACTVDDSYSSRGGGRHRPYGMLRPRAAVGTEEGHGGKMARTDHPNDRAELASLRRLLFELKPPIGPGPCRASLRFTLLGDTLPSWITERLLPPDGQPGQRDPFEACTGRIRHTPPEPLDGDSATPAPTRVAVAPLLASGLIGSGIHPIGARRGTPIPNPVCHDGRVDRSGGTRARRRKRLPKQNRHRNGEDPPGNSVSSLHCKPGRALPLRG